MLCVRCEVREAPGPLGLCPACLVHTRLEVAVGLRRFTAYLDSWAAFDDWLRRRGRGSAFA